MCGICGELKPTGESPDLGGLQRMMDRMIPRGPDSSGLWHQGRVAFGHRRLKIIDLSEKAQQPMVDSALGLTIAFNGCIYNYPELRKTLQDKGYTFFSTGDTEVILKGFHCWGKNVVNHLNGMFAFAIWEREKETLHLVRDRLGIKPLYFIDDPKRFRFASSLPALLAGGDVDTRLDPGALNFYLNFHSIVPPPRTILRGVQKLAPATWMTVGPDGSSSSERYWAPIFAPQPGDESNTEDDWKELTLEVLRRSVQRRIVADVPVGVLLSGGVDSSLVVGLLAEGGQKGLNTFSIGFESVGDEEGDEFKYSDVIVDQFQTDHHKVFVDSSRALPELTNCVRAMSEPMVSHDVIAFYLLSEKVSQHIKVVQSGQGADEIFAGYHWYPPMMESTDAVGDYARVFCDLSRSEYEEAVMEDWLAPDLAREFIREQFAVPGADRPVDKALRMDTTYMLIDDPVKRVDNTSMSWGLEARVPFLDHEVVELGARIPAEYKVKGDGKYILKEAARKVVSPKVIDRPKGYFPVPALKYLEGDYLEMVKGLLLSPEAQDRGLFRPNYIENLLKNPKDHITPLRGSKLWQAALLEYWCREQNI